MNKIKLIQNMKTKIKFLEKDLQKLETLEEEKIK
jgi:DNA-binding protein H-NS